MKTRNNIWLSLFALAIGILLLIFSNETALFSSIVTIIGILLIVPCVIAFIASITPPKGADGAPRQTNWLMVLTSALGTVFGICLVCVPGFFASAIIYVLGALLIIAGLVGIAYLVSASRERHVGVWLYVVPALVIVAGIVIIILGHPRLLDKAAAIVAGICLIVYAVNAIWAGITGRTRHNIAQE